MFEPPCLEMSAVYVLILPCVVVAQVLLASISGSFAAMNDLRAVFRSMYVVTIPYDVKETVVDAVRVDDRWLIVTE